MTREELEAHYVKRVSEIDAAGGDLSKSDELRDLETRVHRKRKAEARKK